MFDLNMVDYPVFFHLLSTLTWDTHLTLRGTLGFYLNHILQPWTSHYHSDLFKESFIMFYLSMGF